MTDHVTLYEMAPRDGLQNEKTKVQTKDKIALVDQLSACGFEKIEVTSFVSPKWVPQMADAADVLAGIQRKDDVRYGALTPNMQGFHSAIEAQVDEVAIFASASEGFSQKNINCSIDESLDRFAPVARAARDAKVPVRGYVSCITDCPYDGPTPPSKVAEVAGALLDMGCYEVSLGDTIGHSSKQTLSAMLDTVLARIPAHHLAGHYHDTKGLALANIITSLAYGLRTFDSSVAGLGGCPFAPGAAGNVASEAVVDLLHERGFTTGIDRPKLETAAAFAAQLRKSA